MTRRTMMLLTLMLAAFTATHSFAHDQFRIVGTISKVEKTQLQVKTAESKTYAIKLDSQTLVSRGKDKVKVTELQVGRSVVVDALGDTEDDLVALEIRLVPAITK